MDFCANGGRKVNMALAGCSHYSRCCGGGSSGSSVRADSVSLYNGSLHEQRVPRRAQSSRERRITGLAVYTRGKKKRRKKKRKPGGGSPPPSLGREDGLQNTRTAIESTAITKERLVAGVAL